MAAKRRFLDVWIVESNTVYREVPFEVVIDWVQQGRLLENDMLRWSGQADWFKLGSTPIFADYMPKPEPFRAEDEAEAHEAVQLDFAWRRKDDDEDDDVDMIPLIDVSLVLLIFFVIISTGNTAAALFNNPSAAHGSAGKREFWVGIRSDPNGSPRSYLHGKNEAQLVSEANWPAFEAKVRDALNKLENPVVVVVFGDSDLKYEHEVQLLRLLEEYRYNPRTGEGKILAMKTGVSDKGGVP